MKNILIFFMLMFCIGFVSAQLPQVVIPLPTSTGGGSTIVINGSANHNDLLNIQGGSSSERYHLTNAEWTNRIYLFNQSVPFANWLSSFLYDYNQTVGAINYVNSNPFNWTNQTSFGNSSWNETYARTIFYNVSNPNGYYNVTTAPTYLNDTWRYNYTSYYNSSQINSNFCYANGTNSSGVNCQTVSGGDYSPFTNDSTTIYPKNTSKRVLLGGVADDGTSIFQVEGRTHLSYLNGLGSESTLLVDTDPTSQVGIVTKDALDNAFEMGVVFGVPFIQGFNRVSELFTPLEIYGNQIDFIVATAGLFDAINGIQISPLGNVIISSTPVDDGINKLQVLGNEVIYSDQGGVNYGLTFDQTLNSIVSKARTYYTGEANGYSQTVNVDPSNSWSVDDSNYAQIGFAEVQSWAGSGNPTIAYLISTDTSWVPSFPFAMGKNIAVVNGADPLTWLGTFPATTSFVVYGDSLLKGNLNVTGNTTLNNLTTNDGALIKGNVKILGNLSVKRPYWNGYYNGTDNFLNTGNVQKMNLSNNNDYDSYGITINSSQSIKFDMTGDYLCIASPEFTNTATTAQVAFWMRKNGADVNWTNSRYSISNGEYLAPAIPFQFDITTPSTDYIEFYWYSTSTNSKIESSGALTSPTRPSYPGVILNCQKVSETT